MHLILAIVSLLAAERQLLGTRRVRFAAERDVIDDRSAGGPFVRQTRATVQVLGRR